MRTTLLVVGAVVGLYLIIRVYFWVYAVNTRTGRERWLLNLRRKCEEQVR
jgi:hypothetical protein